jgi:hypothetical protein
MVTTSSNLTKLRKKLIPPPDGQDVAKLRTATVTSVGSDGTLTINLNGADVPGVPVLSGSGDFLTGRTVQVISYRGSLLVIGTSAAKKANSAITTGTAAGSGTTASAGFTNTLGGSAPYNGIHGVVFVAPPSGVVAVIAKVTGGSGSVAQYTVIDFEIKTGSTIGSGSTVRAPNEGTAGVHQSAVASSQGTLVSMDTVTNLTPGATYNAAIVYHGTGGATSSINRRNIMVLPQ